MAKSKTTLVVIHANIVVYALCFWLVQPIMTYILKEYGASSLSFGAYQSLYGAVQLLGGLMVGDLQDRYSGSTALSITQLGSAAVYGMVALAGNLEMLYLSRLPMILQQAMQVAQACISKATSDGDERSLSLGRLSLSYGAGMIIGSTASGRLADAFGNQAPALLAFAISVGICFVNKITLSDLGDVSKSDTEKEKEAEEKKKNAGKNEYLGLNGYVKLLVKLSSVVVFLVLMFASKSLYEPVYSLTLVSKYDVSKSQMGSLMSGFGVLGMISNVFILPLVLKAAGENTITMISLFGGAACYGALTVGAEKLDVNSYLAVFAVLSVFSALLYTLSTSFISRTVEKAAHGQAIALSHSLRAGVGIVCPLLGTFLLEQYGGASVAGVGAVLLLGAGFSVMATSGKK